MILSQFDDPEYAISLLDEGAAGCAYLLKDHVAEGDQLARAVRAVATGGSVLDPTIVESMVHPVTDTGDLSEAEEELLRLVAEGRPIKAIAVAQGTTATAAADGVEKLFLRIAQQASAGGQNSLRRLRMLHEAIVNREEQGETLSRLLPGGVADLLVRQGRRVGETEAVDVSVLMSDIRGYSSIAERADPSALAGQLNVHRAEMNRAILDADGTVMQFVGDAVMAVFGAPVPLADHAGRAVEAALAMHAAQAKVNEHWSDTGLAPFELGIGVTTGPAAAALLGFRGATGVHTRGRHRQPRPAPPAVGRPRRDGAQRSDLRGARAPPARHRPPARPGEGPGGAGGGLEGGGGDHESRQPRQGVRHARHGGTRRPQDLRGRRCARPGAPGHRHRPWTTPSSWR